MGKSQVKLLKQQLKQINYLTFALASCMYWESLKKKKMKIRDLKAAYGTWICLSTDLSVPYRSSNIPGIAGVDVIAG